MYFSPQHFWFNASFQYNYVPYLTQIERKNSAVRHEKIAYNVLSLLYIETTPEQVQQGTAPPMPLSHPPPVGCRSCPPASKTRLLPSLQFPWGYRLNIGCSRRKVKGKGGPRVSLLSFDFCIPYSRSGIQRNYIWNPSAQGWSRKLPLQLVFLREGLRRRSEHIYAGKV